MEGNTHRAFLKLDCQNTSQVFQRSGNWKEDILAQVRTLSLGKFHI